VTSGRLASIGHTASRAQHALATTSGYDAAFRIGSLIAFVGFVLALTVIRRASVPAVVTEVARVEPEPAVA